MLQNDMGNTMIQDSATGAVMQLSPGFVPVGMKENGGILYIVSANKEGQSEIGTIPSPIITWDYVDISKFITPVTIASDASLSSVQIISNKIYSGEEFLLVLNLDAYDDKGISLWDDAVGYYTCNLYDYDPFETLSNTTLTAIDKKYPLISTINEKGLYTLNLYSCTELQNTLLSTNNAQIFNINESNTLQYSNFWFIPKQLLDKNTINLKYTRLGSNMLKFSSYNNSGKLGVGVSIENISDFRIVKRAGGMVASQGESYLPYTYIYKDKNGNPKTYYTYFSSFSYKSDSSVRVAKLIIKVINNSTNQSIQTYTKKIAPSWPDSALTEGSCSTLVWDEGKLKDTTLRNIASTAESSKNISCNIVNEDQNNILFSTFNYGGNTFYIQKKILSSEEFESDTNTHTSKDSSNDREGLFYIKYDTKEEYNSWYTLTVDYYDQIDRKLGTYTLKFNPYYNDYIGEGTDTIINEDKHLQDNIKYFILTPSVKQEILTYKQPDDTNNDSVKTGTLSFNSSLFNTSYNKNYLTVNSLTPIQFSDAPKVQLSSSQIPIWALLDSEGWYTPKYSIILNDDPKNNKQDYKQSNLNGSADGSNKLYYHQWETSTTNGNLQRNSTKLKDGYKLTALFNSNKITIDGGHYEDRSKLTVSHEDASVPVLCTCMKDSHLAAEDSDACQWTLSHYFSNLEQTTFKITMQLLDEGNLNASGYYGFGNICSYSDKYLIYSGTVGGNDWNPLRFQLGFKLSNTPKVKYEGVVTSSICIQKNHYYTYTNQGGDEINLPGNLYNNLPIKCNLHNINGNVINYISLEGEPASSTIFQNAPTTYSVKHSVPIDFWTTPFWSKKSITNWPEASEIAKNTLTTGWYILNFYGYPLNSEKASSCNLSFKLNYTSGSSPHNMIIQSGCPVLFYVKNTASLSFGDKDGTVGQTTYEVGITALGVYKVDTAMVTVQEEAIEQKSFSLIDYNSKQTDPKQKIVMQLVETLSETGKEYDENHKFDFTYTPEQAYQTTVDLNSEEHHFTN